MKDFNYFQLQAGNLDQIEPSDMAENKSLDAANDIINLIIDKIGQNILDKHINSKYKPHSS